VSGGSEGTSQKSFGGSSQVSCESHKSHVYLFSLHIHSLDSFVVLPCHSVTPVAASIFGPLSQTHFSKSEFKNGQISKSCFVFQVIQVISSGKFFSAEEGDLSFIYESETMNLISKASI